MRNPLFLKLSIGLLFLLLLIGGIVGYISMYTTECFYDEANQKLNKELAKYTVDEVKTFDEDGNINSGEIMKLMHSMMAINPDVEVYLLDKAGKILKFVTLGEETVVRKTVDMGPIQKFIESDGEIHIDGDDPRSADGQKIFSAAPIIKDGEISAYYYIILASQERQAVLSAVVTKYVISIGGKLILTCLFVSLLMGLLYIWYLTKNLNPIMSTMEEFREGNYSARISEDTNDFNDLARTYNKMAHEIESNITKIKSIDNFRKELIANISHDLKTPISIIRGYAEMLTLKKDELTEEEKLKYLNNINESTKRVTGLMHQLLELSKLENNQIELKEEPFSLPELASDLMSRFELLLKEKNIKFGFDIEENLPLAYGDIALVERVIQNLVDNAIKYSPMDSEIKIGLNKKQGGIEFVITDEGKGIDQKNINKIFNRYTTSNEVNKLDKSFGLGLAISKKILELHNSTIAVSSKLNIGTTFSFQLPTTSMSMA